MITVELARSGHSILMKNERLLASSFDPIKEANTWAQKVVSQLEPGCSIVVLGLATGYHIAALEKLAPASHEIYVIENDVSLVQWAADLCPQIERTRLICEPHASGLIDHFYFRNLLTGGVFKIVPHGPSYQSETSFYREVESLLNGRDRVAFLTQLKARPELAALVEDCDLSAVGDEPVSIKTLQKMFNPRADGTRERTVWRVLEELVA